MHVTFSGAAREVTGSCYLVTAGEHTVALRGRGYDVHIPSPGDAASF